MIKCLIVEDEIAGQEMLLRKLKIHFPECDVIAVIDNKEDAIDYLLNNELDLVFLDVQIKGGTGLEVLESIKQPEFESIFITAYDKYAIEALNSNASYYLLKPIHDREFKKGMLAILDKIRTKNKKNAVILIPDKGNQIPVQLEDILYFESEGAYTSIYFKEEKLLSSKNIGYYEKLLAENQFVRSHHSYLVNITKITRMIKGRSGVLIMSDGKEIPVAQRRLSEFLNYFIE